MTVCASDRKFRNPKSEIRNSDRMGERKLLIPKVKWRSPGFAGEAGIV